MKKDADSKSSVNRFFFFSSTNTYDIQLLFQRLFRKYLLSINTAVAFLSYSFLGTAYLDNFFKVRIRL